jgi:hypothetical protein
MFGNKKNIKITILFEEKNESNKCGALQLISSNRSSLWTEGLTVFLSGYELISSPTQG